MIVESKDVDSLNYSFNINQLKPCEDLVGIPEKHIKFMLDNPATAQTVRNKIEKELRSLSLRVFGKLVYRHQLTTSILLCGFSLLHPKLGQKMASGKLKSQSTIPISRSQLKIILEIQLELSKIISAPAKDIKNPDQLGISCYLFWLSKQPKNTKIYLEFFKFPDIKPLDLDLAPEHALLFEKFLDKATASNPINH